MKPKTIFAIAILAAAIAATSLTAGTAKPSEKVAASPAWHSEHIWSRVHVVYGPFGEPLAW